MFFYLHMEHFTMLFHDIASYTTIKDYFLKLLRNKNYGLSQYIILRLSECNIF